jgi:hypothetical protein
VLPEPELVEPDTVPELLLPDDAVTVAEPDDVLAAGVAAVAVLAAEVASAGSLPVASCTKIPPVTARKIAVDRATTRRRICEIRSSRARSRSDTTRVAVGPATGRRAERSGTALVEASGGAIVYLFGRDQEKCEDKGSLRLVAMPCEADKEVV